MAHIFGYLELHHRQTPQLYGHHRFTGGRIFRSDIMPSDNLIDIWDLSWSWRLPSQWRKVALKEYRLSILANAKRAFWQMLKEWISFQYLPSSHCKLKSLEDSSTERISLKHSGKCQMSILANAKRVNIVSIFTFLALQIRPCRLQKSVYPKHWQEGLGLEFWV